MKVTSGLIWAVVLGTASGCGYPYWYVHVRSEWVEDVIVRVEYNGGHRDVFVPKSTDVDVIKLPGAQPPATVSLLDPETCAVLSAGDLPTKSAYVAFGDAVGHPRELGELGIFVAKNDPVGSVAPIDDRCAGT